MTFHHERPDLLNNPRADRVRKVGALSGRSARQRSGRFLVEGPQAVRELLNFRAETLVDVYMSEAAASAHPDILARARQVTRWVHMTSTEVAVAMSPDAQGVLAVATHDAVERELGTSDEGSCIVILAQGRDPGNVGTIIRTADAMGARAVVTVAGTVDVANPKVIRASAGSVFHLPIVPLASFEEAVERVHRLGGTVLGTSGGHGVCDLVTLLHEGYRGQGPLCGTHAWALGNEAQGLCAAELAACDQLVAIPMTGKAESLNVASAAAMCLFASQSLSLAPGSADSL